MRLRGVVTTGYAVTLMGFLLCGVADAAPKLKVRQDSFDFGYVAEGLPIFCRYWVLNEGKDSLVINKVKPSCGCTTVPLPKTTLAAGDSVQVDLRFDTKKFKGKVEKTSSIDNNDPDQPLAKIKFTATVGLWQGVVTPTPSVAYLDTLGKTEQVIILNNASIAPYSVRVSSAPASHLQLEFNATKINGKGELRAVVRTTPNTPIGEFNSSVTFHFDGGPEPHAVTVPIYGVGYLP